MAKRKSGDYFNFGRGLSIVFAIIPITSFLFGVVTRFKEKKYVAAILRLFTGWNIIYLLDLIFIISKGKITRLINC